MKLQQQFIVAQPIATVWNFFRDIPQVAACLPGAEYLGLADDGKHKGKVSSKIGPFQASFEGEADITFNDVERTVEMKGKGVDRKGGSRGQMTMSCGLDDLGDTTRVRVDTDLQLSGVIAQFGRTGLITEIANALVADFVRNAESRMSVSAVGIVTEEPGGAKIPGVAKDAAGSQGKPINLFGLLLISLKSQILSLLGRKA